MKMQKCLHLKDELSKKKPKLDGEYILSPKKDGWYVQLPYKDGKWLNPLSSAEREIPAFSWWKDNNMSHRKAAPKGEGFLIVEAYLKDTPFHITNGIFNRSVGDFLCHDVMFAAHDLIEFDKKFLSAGTRADRLADLVEYMRNSHNLVSNIEVLKPEGIYLYNETLWKQKFDQFISKGEEGLVGKRRDSIFLPGKRNSDLLKLKLELTAYLQAVRLERSIGEKGNEAITLISKRKNGVEVRTVIAAFKEINKWLNIEAAGNITSQVVEIKAMEEFEDGQLRQPVYKCIRDDKTIAELVH